MDSGHDGLLRRGRRAAGLSRPDYSHRSRAEKLGVREGVRARLVGLHDPGFERELSEHRVALDAAPPLDLVFLRVERPSDLEQLSQLRTLLSPAGAIWVVRTKGSSRAVTEMDIIDAGKRHGLVDNKIASFSDTLSATRLVIPVSQRTKSGGD